MKVHSAQSNHRWPEFTLSGGARVPWHQSRSAASVLRRKVWLPFRNVGRSMKARNWWILPGRDYATWQRLLSTQTAVIQQTPPRAISFFRPSFGAHSQLSTEHHRSIRQQNVDKNLCNNAVECSRSLSQKNANIAVNERMNAKQMVHTRHARLHFYSVYCTEQSIGQSHISCPFHAVL